MLGLFIVVTLVVQRLFVLPNTAGKKELYGSNTCLINDLIVFHKVIHNSILASLPKEVIQNRSRTRSSNSNLTYQLTESVSAPKHSLTNSFFIRSMSHWNRLPNEIRELVDQNEFRISLEKHFWMRTLSHSDNNIPESDREPD